MNIIPSSEQIHENKNKILTESKVFCMSPWTHLHGLPTGDVIPCCLAPFELSVGNLKKESIIDIWNSKKMRELRVNMLNDTPSNDVCNRCYSKQDHNFSTLRTGLNDRYGQKYFDIVESTHPDGTVDELNLVHWDFRFSNICNLKCRTCGPGFSTPWFDDYLKLYNIKKEEAPHPKYIQIVEEKDRFWDMINPLYPYVESIHFAGGEPLLMDEHYRIMYKLLEENNTDLEILYSTNFTILKYKSIDIAELWKHFSNIILSLSIDGANEHFDHIRSGGSWLDIVANFERFKIDTRLSHIKYRIHATVGILNIFHITDLHEILLENQYISRDKFNPNPNDYYHNVFMINALIQPDYYNIQSLPIHLKDLAADKIRTHITFIKEKYDIISDGFDNLITYMYAADTSERFVDFIIMTDKIDAIRGENTLKIIPELFEYLK